MLYHSEVLEHASVGLFATDAGAGFTYVNRYWCEMSGQNLWQAMGAGWLNALHFDDRERIATAWHDAAARGEEFRTEGRYRRPDGSDLWVMVVAKPIRKNGAVTGYAGTVTDISERRRTEGSWRDLFHIIPDTMLVVQGGRISFSNDSATKLLGYAAHELAGMDPTTLLATGQDIVRERMRQVAHTDKALPWRRTRMRRRNGNLAVVESTVVRTPYLGPDAVIVIMRDLSEPNRLAERIRAGVEGMPDAFAVLDAVLDGNGDVTDFRIAEANTLLEGIWGHPQSHLIGAMLSKVAPEVLGGCARAFEVGSPVSLDVDRGAQVLQEMILPVPDGVAIVIRDVTEGRAQQQELELRGVVMGNMADGVAAIRASDHTIIYANASLCRMHGWGVGELTGKSATVLRPPDLTDEEIALRLGIGEALNVEGDVNTEVRNGRADGSSIICQSTSTTMDLPGHGRVWVCVLRDITADLAARRELGRMACLVDSSGDAIVALDSRGSIVTWNDAAERLLGRAKDDVLGQPLALVSPPEDLAVLLARARTGQRVDAWETSWTRPDGVVPVLSLQISPVMGGQGDPMGVSLIARDVTARKEAERVIRDSLAQKDVLLREIHHRVKNNLQVISSLFSLQSRRVTDRAASLVLQESQARVRSIALLHERLYRTGDVARVVMSDYARRLAVEVLRACGSPERVRAEVEVGPVSLSLDSAVPCGLILNELITNAIKHAFPDGRAGTVKVAFSQEQDFITLRVADDGAGLPAGAQPSTSDTLGMHLIHTLADQLDGSATFLSGLGTACEIRFPAKENRA